METFYLILVIVLGALAVSDLVVGVSNDAVNFVNSAIGSKAASFKVVMAIAALGVFVGASFSTGMMEVARKGIFHPENFFFADLMVIFLAVMITDVLLLDLFNTFGLPTSTTVSLVFELLGAAVAVSLIKIYNDVNALELSQYINSANALGIISGILISVVISFSVGAAVQYIARIIFSFNFKKTIQYFGGIYGGIAITSIVYFILMKGAKDSTILPKEVIEYIKNNTWFIISVSFVVFSILLQLSQFLFKLNILKLVVLAGTFALALAFAGNDLVNFIGVPLAGYNAYSIFIASPGANPDGMLMQELAGKVPTPTLFLLIAGLIMVITLYVSKKARTVTKTSVDLSRQGEGDERFGSSVFARSIVRAAVSLGSVTHAITPKAVSRFLNKRFDQTAANIAANDNADAPAFDLLRASVNLVVASILISIATSFKLPLSTTYVTFMVAMGTSLSDKAWGNDSAVYRITGVISVIGGWFFTAFSAFSAAFVIASTIYFGGIYAIIALIIAAVFFMYRTHIMHKNRVEEEVKSKVIAGSHNKKLEYSQVIKTCKANITAILSQVADNYSNAIEGINTMNRKLLKDTLRDVIAVNAETKKLKENIPSTIARLEDDSIHNGHYYVQVLDYLRETAHCLTYIARPAFEHLDNNHRAFSSSQIDDLSMIKSKMAAFIDKNMVTIANNEFDKIDELIEEQHQLISLIEEMRYKQIKRIKGEETGTKSSMLYMGIMHESKNVLLYSINLLKAQRDFVEAEKKPHK